MQWPLHLTTLKLAFFKTKKGVSSFLFATKRLQREAGLHKKKFSSGFARPSDEGASFLFSLSPFLFAVCRAKLDRPQKERGKGRVRVKLPQEVRFFDLRPFSKKSVSCNRQHIAPSKTYQSTRLEGAFRNTGRQAIERKTKSRHIDTARSHEIKKKRLV